MSTLTGKDLNLVKPALTDDHKVTIGTDLPANFQKIDDEFTAHLAETVYHVGSFTRDLSLASGNYSVTGLGFTPKAVIMMGADYATAHRLSIGLATSNNSRALTDFNGSVTGSWRVYGPRFIWFYDSDTDYVTGTITMDSDGFTIAFVKTGSPTGTADFGFMALSHY